MKNILQELSPTNDANLVYSHMSLMETLMDEFQDENEFKKLNEREVTAWLEVCLPKRSIVHLPV